ncbi:uncharacterized protein BDR25DRAFT_305745 [Lindgomyces ingoldianus]|uniref:Uncharacterized protein n=1 Tax=Lindgomyces ingoldianus TaxID=673940 RepID=A0ACB6QM32_9PLEO|nr:uncharacterized protein BDR25DRAFT_305745 [Lindgomyces ingoldianus]KAF2467367.1 hypothetical protein BDR25DRAFT_305745 [Lindgomyces ingoldianus]
MHDLEFYHYCAGPTLASRFDNEFWSRISLQMAYTEPAVRHALVALGYLSRQETGSLKHARLGFTNGDKRKLFLLHYNKSVRHLVHRIAEPSYSPEIGLVTCVLFVCIEFLRADYHTAFTHMRNGLKIISELRQTRQTDSPIQTPEGIQSGSTTPTDMIEEKLVPMFIRGMASALLYGVSVEDDFAVPCPLPQSFQERRFTSIREAQSSYHEIRNAAIVFTRQMAIKLIQLIPVTVEDFLRRYGILECHRAWYEAFQELECSQILSLEDKVTISALKLSYYATYIFAACATDVRQMSFDAHLSSFKALLHHAKIVFNFMDLGNLEDPQAKPSSRSAAANFTFEISIIPSLYFTATRCRCPTTRREAVSLLSLNPPREGLWDPEQHVVVSNRVIEIEEMEVDEKGWPTEEMRLWSTVIDANMDQTGGFWVDFLPAKWVGSFDGEGRQRLRSEWFVLGEPWTSPPSRYSDPLRIMFSPNTAPLH